MFAGFAIGPIFFADVVAQLLELLDRRLDAAFSVTNATIACPVIASCARRDGGLGDVGWSTSADSTSIVEMRWPETFITSSTRPSSQKSPSSSMRAPSPAK
jgi:hypothetical protein